MRRYYQVCLGVVTFLVMTHCAAAGVSARFLFDLEDGMNQPSAVSLSEDGSAFVLDGLRGRVVRFDREGRRAGAFAAPADDALQLPMDLLWHEDTIIVSDTGNHRLMQFDRNGRVQRILSLTPDGDKEAEPTGLALLDGIVYWSDRANSRVCATDLESGESIRCWGAFGSSEGEFRYPFLMTIDRDRYLYVTDVLNGRVQVFNERGRPFGAIERFGVTQESFLRPNGVAMDAQGTLMVSDTYQGRILVFKGRGFSGLLTDQEGKPLRFDQPVGISRWRNRLYVTEMAQHRVRVYEITDNQQAQPSDEPPTYFTEPTRRDCVTCHLSWSEGYRADETDTSPILPVGSRRMCMSCHHGAVIDSRRSLETGEQHPDYHHPDRSHWFDRDELRKEGMPEGFPLVENKEPYCGSCHTPHRFSEDDTGLDNHGENLWMRDENTSDELCLRCHEAHGDTASESLGIIRNHPYDVALEKPPSGVHEGYAQDEFLQRGLPETLARVEARVDDDQRLICATCHRAHGGGRRRSDLVIGREGLYFVSSEAVQQNA
ncbi:MAG: NHL repeat-containing protein [Candidatus Thiodiazotropha sp.]